MRGLGFVFCFLALFSVQFMLSSAVDTISAGGSISDGETLVSSNGSFELGFFDPGNSKRYLGIWYKKMATGTVVWVANRDAALNDTSGILRLTNGGILIVLGGEKANLSLWSSTTSQDTLQGTTARLLDTGNLVVTASNVTLWQSFDHMGNTFLPGMKGGRNLVTGLDNYYTSWKSGNDPSTGSYINKLVPNGYPQMFQWKGSVIDSRSGPWNGLSFSGVPALKKNPIYSFGFVYNDKEIYYYFELLSSAISRVVLDPSGKLQRFVWMNRTQQWNLYNTAQRDTCDSYSTCGAYGSCNINNSPICGCLRGFTQKFPSDWASGDWSEGCVRETNLSCTDRDRFAKISNLKLPDTRTSRFNRTMGLRECEKWCLRNCSCTAYSRLNISGEGGSGCLLWFDELIDIRSYSAPDGQDLYLRLAASELGSNGNGKRRLGIILIPVLLGSVILGSVCLWLALKKKKQMELHEESMDIELPIFGLDAILDATDNFSNKNKLGEGGYGPVYKGKLSDGREIAVKRLSIESKQGVDEFKNEVLLIAKLQHRNLVKLLGCCIQEEEKMLIYEYMPNGSLDSFIFDKAQSKQLDWPQRLKIIHGIARGLLYLHQDSRLRIIHRDLKASNILLDYEMNAKISDFGMARSFGGDETQANTRRVVGTYGYMSPEYAIDGLISVKLDVFAFGVLVLEIISGQRNRGFYHADHNFNLLGHAWKLFQAGQPEILMDGPIRDSCDEISQVLRSIQVGLLCVQQSLDDRPNMASVVLMLGSEITLPLPNEPGFFTQRHPIESDSSSGNKELYSKNEMTISILRPR